MSCGLGVKKHQIFSQRNTDSVGRCFFNHGKWLWWLCFCKSHWPTFYFILKINVLQQLHMLAFSQSHIILRLTLINKLWNICNTKNHCLLHGSAVAYHTAGGGVKNFLFLGKESAQLAYRFLW